MIRICGDVNITDGYFDVGFGLGSLVKKGKNPFEAISKEKDYWIGNFEGVASSTSVLNGVPSNQFRISPSDISDTLGLFNAMGIANNHVMQHGDCAYQETARTLCDRGIKTFGKADSKTIVFDYSGRSFSITGLCQRLDQFSAEPLYWHNPEIKEIEQELSSIPHDAYKIIYVHWGYEFINRPSQHQKLLAHLLVDMGFDLVIGMHPHVLQGFEVYKSKYIFYSLGNFSFNMPWERTQYGAVVNLQVENKEVNITYDYTHIDSQLNTAIIEEEQVPLDYRFPTLNKLLSASENGELYFQEVNHFYKKYRKANHKDIFTKMISHPSAAFFIMKDFIKRRIIH